MRTALEMQPDLIVTDWNMPVMNGLEMLESLKAAGYRGSVGFVTTECTADMRIQASQSGASFLISKPFTPDDFQRTLGPILGV
jgi:two-component system chemotaxis response regulator CheY